MIRPRGKHLPAGQSPAHRIRQSALLSHAPLPEPSKRKRMYMCSRLYVYDYNRKRIHTNYTVKKNISTDVSPCPLARSLGFIRRITGSGWLWLKGAGRPTKVDNRLHRLRCIWHNHGRNYIHGHNLRCILYFNIEIKMQPSNFIEENRFVLLLVGLLLYYWRLFI